MSGRQSLKPCGCTVIKFTGLDKHWGTLSQMCDKCRFIKGTGKNPQAKSNQRGDYK